MATDAASAFACTPRGLSSDLGQAFGIASDCNLRGPGFYESHALQRAFSVAGIDLYLETYTVWRPDLLPREKREFVEILQELGAS